MAQLDQFLGGRGKGQKFFGCDGGRRTYLHRYIDTILYHLQFARSRKGYIHYQFWESKVRTTWSNRTGVKCPRQDTTQQSKRG